MKPISLPVIAPLIPKKKLVRLNDPDWIYEPKLDGFRGGLYWNGRSALLRSKSLDHLSFPKLKKQLEGLLHTQDMILDGEIVSFDGSGRPSFAGLLKRHGEICFVAFDIMWVNGRDLRDLPLSERKKILAEVVPESSRECLRSMYWNRGLGTGLAHAVMKQDLEGVIAKKASSPYRRGPFWYKIPNSSYSKSHEHDAIARAKT